MATPYSNIYNYFLAQVTDFGFITDENFTEDDLHEQFHYYLVSSTTKFKQCKNDLKDRDDTNRQFNEDLTDEEIEILATMMVSAYMKPKIIHSNNLEQKLSDNEFKIYSQANHIKELRQIKKDVDSEVSHLLSSYSLNGGLQEFLDT